MKVLITGGTGFIGQNLQVRLAERSDLEIINYTRDSAESTLPDIMKDVDFVFHLAGVNRPADPKEFVTGNQNLTESLCNAIAMSGRNVPVIYTSSSQAALDNQYGVSKRAAENALFELQSKFDASVYIFRLPNVFGKWSRPNYNSVVATFCHNIAHCLPLQINDASAVLTLVYVDDVVEHFIDIMDHRHDATYKYGFESVTPQYSITVGELADQINAFRSSRSNLQIDRVGTGLIRALYSTYLSYLPKEQFTYAVPQHGDDRGVFVEMLKTPDSGQFSYFTAHAGVTRGGHYHHSKTEKFLVIKGHARFRFRHLVSGEIHELETTGSKAEIVETVPGWTHDITNIGSEEMLVMLWANEIFDRSKPDTFACAV